MLYKKSHEPMTEALFQNPGSEYRAAPFWAWNSKLNKEDLLWQIEQMKKMGGIGSILNMLPGVSSKTADLEEMVDEAAMERTRAMILSMTPQERRNPSLLNVSRKARIAKGAGVEIQEVNRLVKQFEQSKKLMKQMPGLMGGGVGRKRFGGLKLPF